MAELYVSILLKDVPVTISGVGNSGNDSTGGSAGGDSSGGVAGDSGSTSMPEKTMTVRLLCTLDSGEKQWGPGSEVALPESLALELLEMGCAVKIEAQKAAKSRKKAQSSGQSGAEATSGEAKALPPGESDLKEAANG